MTATECVTLITGKIREAGFTPDVIGNYIAFNSKGIHYFVKVMSEDKVTYGVDNISGTNISDRYLEDLDVTENSDHIDVFLETTVKTEVFLDIKKLHDQLKDIFEKYNEDLITEIIKSLGFLS